MAILSWLGMASLKHWHLSQVLKEVGLAYLEVFQAERTAGTKTPS